MEASTLETERQIQRQWRLLPQCEGITAFDVLLSNELREPDDILRSQASALSQQFQFSAQHVPFYSQLFEDLKINPSRADALSVLRRLPCLEKKQIQDNPKALCAKTLPRDEKLFGWFASSGTTGRPTRVLHTAKSNAMFSFLVQRGLRWSRWNPMSLRGDIRVATQFPADDDGKRAQVGASVRLPRWRYVGDFFETGEYAGLCVTAPLAKQLDWLEQTGPDYLLAYPSTLERLAHALGKDAAQSGIKGLLGISEQMTAAVRQRVESNFQASVAQNYGLNEIGIVAQRCQAGRYHVNAEHCIVELLDEQGRVCRDGEIGRLVVTALRNRAMPLFRYDTGDLAEATASPCKCGRNLPSFGTVFGRYRRMVHAPDGTSLQVYVLKSTLESMPPDLNVGLRQYQIRQRRDGAYTLLLKIAQPLPSAFEEELRSVWLQRFGEDAPGISLQIVDDIPLSASGKMEDFVSEFSAPAGR